MRDRTGPDARTLVLERQGACASASGRARSGRTATIAGRGEKGLAMGAAKKPAKSSPDRDQIELIKLALFRVLDELVLVRKMLEDPARGRPR